MIYHINKIKSRTVNTDPSLTDQAGARDADINVIVGQFLIHGQAPGHNKPPIEGADFTNMPTDLRGFIEMGKSIQGKKASLPKQLQGMTTDQLLALTPEDLKTILTPPKPAEDKKDEQK